jgi:hypothetical protein
VSRWCVTSASDDPGAGGGVEPVPILNMMAGPRLTSGQQRDGQARRTPRRRQPAGPSRCEWHPRSADDFVRSWAIRCRRDRQTLLRAVAA